MKSLPYFCRGEVVRGFGRGSKELGIPTANFPDSVVDNLPADISTGIYYGWACVGNGDVYKMVMSIGWNPYYKNTKKSMETHVIHKFKEDFYGQTLSVVLVGYIRSEKSFPSLGMLSSAFLETGIRKSYSCICTLVKGTNPSASNTVSSPFLYYLSPDAQTACCPFILADRGSHSGHQQRHRGGQG
uniref:Riboflavin kinase n=1 Tax=Poecilia reticulata TaxID=8081 RepID=A0A3P9Q9E3_POERE